MTKETISKYCKEYLENEQELKRLKARQEAIKQKLQNAELEETPKYKIVKREVASTLVFDSGRFRTEHMDIYNAYKTKEKAGYFSIKITAIQ